MTRQDLCPEVIEMIADVAELRSDVRYVRSSMDEMRADVKELRGSDKGARNWAVRNIPAIFAVVIAATALVMTASNCG